jgi:hypothetical protein
VICLCCCSILAGFSLFRFNFVSVHDPKQNFIVSENKPKHNQNGVSICFGSNRNNKKVFCRTHANTASPYSSCFSFANSESGSNQSLFHSLYMFIVSRQSQEGAESLLFLTVTPLINTESGNDQSMFSSVLPIFYVLHKYMKEPQVCFPLLLLL